MMVGITSHERRELPRTDLAVCGQKIGSRTLVAEPGQSTCAGCRVPKKQKRLGGPALATCVDCRRGLRKHDLEAAETPERLVLKPPDWCAWCARAVSGDAKMAEERAAAARQTDLLEACRMDHDFAPWAS